MMPPSLTHKSKYDRDMGYCPAADMSQQAMRRRDAEQGSAELLRRLIAEHGEQGRADIPMWLLTGKGK